MDTQAHWHSLEANDPEVFAAIRGEERRESRGIELIPSESYAFPEVLATSGSILTNKYSEGYPGRRYYGGQDFTDAVERLAIERACRVFRAEHANVQALSGAAMNLAVYLGLLEPGDVVLAMELSHGGHLTHGAPVSHVGRLFRFVRYRTTASGAIDFDEVRRLALEHRPKLVLCGHSSYPRELDYASFRSVADEVGALAMADVSHLGGLIAAGVADNPVDAGFDVVTTTTHKTLRGPRGGIILCTRALAKAIDKSVFPGLQGGPHMNAIAGIAVALRKTQQPEFRVWAGEVLRNARRLADGLTARGAQLVTGGTDNHLMVVDTQVSFEMDGRRAQETLDRVGITVNKQVIPDDPAPPARPSGIRLGTPAATTRGFGPAEMDQLAAWIVDTLRGRGDASRLDAIRGEVEQLCLRCPVPGLEVPGSGRA